MGSAARPDTEKADPLGYGAMSSVGYAAASSSAPAEELKAAEEGALDDDPKYVYILYHDTAHAPMAPT